MRTRAYLIIQRLIHVSKCADLLSVIYVNTPTTSLCYFSDIFRSEELNQSKSWDLDEAKEEINAGATYKAYDYLIIYSFRD